MNSPATISRIGHVAMSIERSVDHPHLQRWLAGKEDKALLAKELAHYLNADFLDKWEDNYALTSAAKFFTREKYGGFMRYKGITFIQAIENLTRMLDVLLRNVKYSSAGKKAELLP